MAKRGAPLRLFWILPAVLGLGGCAYSPPVAVLPPPDMVTEGGLATGAKPKEKPPVQQLRPARIGNTPPPQQQVSGDELARIEDLQRRGVITEQEVQKLKQQLQAREQPEAETTDEAGGCCGRKKRNPYGS